MTEPLTHEDGSSIILSVLRDTVSLTVRGPTAPASSPVVLTLAEVEALQKTLETMAAQVRGVKARGT